MFARILFACLLMPMAAVADCRNNQGFEPWLNGFVAEAQRAGIGPATLRKALAGVAYQPDIIARDRRQGFFSRSFPEIARRLVTPYRLRRGRRLLEKHAVLLARITRDYGVPAPVLVALWGLETDFGGNLGDVATIPALASLAYDCRRPELFRPQLLDALRLLDNGDLRHQQMRGAWAGEIGQTQFLPSDYLRSAVDYDGDGRRDLITSLADALASSANLLRRHGWQRGGAWLEEVQLPAAMPWEITGLGRPESRARWGQLGVRRVDGGPLPADSVRAALILPVGKLGPAFLAYPNFPVFLAWNKSRNYALTGAYFATRLAGAAQMRPGRGTPAAFGGRQIYRLQTQLVRRGFDVGGVDGKLGAKTRAAVRAMQQHFGLPADSYPTPGLLQRLEQNP